MRITVCVDNTLSFQTIPPGVVEQTPAGPAQRYWHDFYNYAGLHRTVWLACTPAARIEDVTVVTGLDGTTGTVDYRVDAAERGRARRARRAARRRRRARSAPGPARRAW